jgi:hypothetical protein
MSEDERPGDEHGQEELIAGFAALGGRLTGDELMRLFGSARYYRTLVQLAELLLDGDTAAAEDVARDSLAALQQARSRLVDPEKARLYLLQAVVNRARSTRGGAPRAHRRRARRPARRGPGHHGPGAAGLRGLPEPGRRRTLHHRSRYHHHNRAAIRALTPETAARTGQPASPLRSPLLSMHRWSADPPSAASRCIPQGFATGKWRARSGQRALRPSG